MSENSHPTTTHPIYKTQPIDHLMNVLVGGEVETTDMHVNGVVQNVARQLLSYAQSDQRRHQCQCSR